MSDDSTFVSLDPADWTTHRRVAHQALDLMLDYQETIADGPVWRPMPPEKQARLQLPLPTEGEGIEAAFREFRETVHPYVLGNPHPRFWGWVPGQGTPGGIVAELLAAGVNAVTGPFNDSSARVEAQVVDWLREAVGMPQETGGVLTSGGSVANLIGLAVGRDAVATADVPGDGLIAEGRGLAVYASEAVHSSVKKSLQILGMGRRSLRSIPVDDDHRIRVEALEDVLREDRKVDDVAPALLVGSAGTVDTGAFDDFEALADIAEREGLWLHVDGAFGALAALAPDLRSLAAGIERADSLAFDAHKWMSAPYDVGVILVRNREAHERSFTVEASYLSALPRGTGARPESTDHLSPQLSRGFRALSVWMSIREHGIRHFGRVVQGCVEQARYLASRVREHPDLELMAPVPLCIVCFRYTVPGLSPEEEDSLNREILMRLQEQGIAVPSSTVLDGRFVLRVANTNHRTRREDFDRLVEATVRLGEEVRRDRSVAATDV